MSPHHSCGKSNHPLLPLSLALTLLCFSPASWCVTFMSIVWAASTHACIRMGLGAIMQSAKLCYEWFTKVQCHPQLTHAVLTKWEGTVVVDATSHRPLCPCIFSVSPCTGAKGFCSHIEVSSPGAERRYLVVRWVNRKPCLVTITWEMNWMESSYPGVI